MGFGKKTVQDLASLIGELRGKTILVKVDFNVPISDGEITEDLKIRAALPTIQFLLEAEAKVVLMSHLGRPKGKVISEFSLAPVAKRLGELLGDEAKEVRFVPATVGAEVRKAVDETPMGSVVLLENLRFDPREEQNDADFAAEIVQSTGASGFVQDGFGVSHRAHASAEAITHLLPSVAGFLVEDEVSKLTAAVENPKRPLLVIVGGAKIADKVLLIERMAELADRVVIGGAMANTFLKFRGLPVGKSLVEDGVNEVVRRVLEKFGEKILLPVDVVVADEINADANVLEKSVDVVLPDDIILDLGPKSRAEIVGEISEAATVIWNGNLGYTEIERFAATSVAVAEALGRATDKLSIIGGGDTAGFVLEHQETHPSLSYSLISTGGGASLELLSGMKLPGIEALLDR